MRPVAAVARPGLSEEEAVAWLRRLRPSLKGYGLTVEERTPSEEQRVAEREAALLELDAIEHRLRPVEAVEAARRLLERRGLARLERSY